MHLIVVNEQEHVIFCSNVPLHVKSGFMGCITMLPGTVLTVFDGSSK